MREIKFRAWDTERKQMLDPFTLQHAIRIRLNTDPTDTDIYMQFTGLKDKNGKEIYEGDVIEMEEPVMESAMIKCPIVFHEGGFVAEWDRGSQVTYFPLSDCHLEDENVEIIGNIWENPELISKEI